MAKIIQNEKASLLADLDLIRRQATLSFKFTWICVFSGLLLISLGTLAHFIGIYDSFSNITSLSGIVVEFISGTAFVIYKMNFNRHTKLVSRLSRIDELKLAFEQAMSLPSLEQNEQKVSIIETIKRGD